MAARGVVLSCLLADRISSEWEANSGFARLPWWKQTLDHSHVDIASRWVPSANRCVACLMLTLLTHYVPLVCHTLYALQVLASLFVLPFIVGASLLVA